ncbi:MAG TPA: DUF1957 domain-containing protein [Kiritimatiellia bacterium]|nr:DUF1957 domain-containing protein [Kiritimatiellia bacterium]
MKNNNPIGYLCLVLHAHLPYVRHPEFPEFIEERWLFEAVRECYLPLLRILKAREMKPGAARITLSLSPTLMAMLDDELLGGRCERYLERVARLAESQVGKTKGDASLHPIACFYDALSRKNLEHWRSLGDGGVVSAFADLEKAGALELITTSATHAFLPIWKRHPDATRRQIRTGVTSFRERVGHDPSGFWLPECGYYPGLEKYLNDEGIKYFILETHGLTHARPRPAGGVYAPLYCPNGIAAFGRDPESSQQVWSARLGYPADYDYREYYRDIGGQMPINELQALFPDADLNPSTGFKYHRITGPGEQKAPYHPGLAAEKARRHAADFLDKKVAQAKKLRSDLRVTPVITAPFDAELFGHWWFEGPLFLEALLELADQTPAIAMVTPSDYLVRHSEGSTGVPSASTWGARGYHDVWLNDTTAWMYPHLYRAAERAARLPEITEGEGSEVSRRLLVQARREILLAQSSDWPFMMNAGRHLEYAEKRVRDHLSRFYWLADALERQIVNEAKLSAIEKADPIFNKESLLL